MDISVHCQPLFRKIIKYFKCPKQKVKIVCFTLLNLENRNGQTKGFTKMKRFFKKTLTGLAVAMLVLLLAAVVTAAFFQEAVGKKLIAEINKQLETELKVGGFELSLIKGFPNATASFHDVVVTGKFGEGLLEAKDMAFHFRLLSLFGPQVKVHSVAISDGALNVHIDERGKGQF